MALKKAHALALLSFAIATVGLWKAATTPIGSDRPVDPEVAQVILTDMLAKRVSDNGDDVFCVGAIRSGVDLAVLGRRFRARILPLNACRMNARGAVIVVKSGERAEFVRVDGSSCTIIGNRCEVDASTVYGSLGGNGFLYTVERQAGGWTILDVRDSWIS